VDAFGVDISEYAINSANESVKDYCKVSSIADPLDDLYDVIISIEVVEHMEKSESEAAITNLCKHTNKILFSSSPHDFSEVTHINVQQPEVWAQIFARNGFFRDLDYDASYITPWAALFHRDSQRLDKLVQNYERKLWLIFKENLDVRRKNLELIDQIKQKDLANLQPTEIESINNELSKTGGLLEDAKKRIAELESALYEITDSEDWRLMQEVKRIRDVTI
jgi:cyclopropane fatty-acyl-phospholipid synthase-like methyltransferase